MAQRRNASLRSNQEVAMTRRTGAARITAGSLDLASTIRGWELHVRAGGRSRPRSTSTCAAPGSSWPS
jgi:hypothetical protein